MPDGERDPQLPPFDQLKEIFVTQRQFKEFSDSMFTKFDDLKETVHDQEQEQNKNIQKMTDTLDTAVKEWKRGPTITLWTLFRIGLTIVTSGGVIGIIWQVILQVR